MVKIVIFPILLLPICIPIYNSLHISYHSNRFINGLIEDLGEKYDVEREDGLELITVRHYTSATIAEITENHQILIEQKNKNTAIFLSQGTQEILVEDCCCLQEKRQ